MLAALDVHYDEAAAVGTAAGVIFRAWDAAVPTRTVLYRHQGMAPYVPGNFVLRELPCLLPLVEAIRQTWTIGTLIIDGFVDLGPARPGLGRYLFESLSREVEIVGISKSPFTGSPGLPVMRGISRRPLWVTSSGDLRLAAERVAHMPGEHRIPTMLKLADALSRGHAAPDEIWSDGMLSSVR